MFCVMLEGGVFVLVDGFFGVVIGVFFWGDKCCLVWVVMVFLGFGWVIEFVLNYLY